MNWHYNILENAVTEAVGGVRDYNMLFSHAFNTTKYTVLATVSSRFFVICVLPNTMEITQCTLVLKNWSATDKHSHRGFTALFIGS